jgi:hypothetical protein
MQKALTQMNLQLANVISDLSGVTGQKIVRAIVAPYLPRIDAPSTISGHFRHILVSQK